MASVDALTLVNRVLRRAQSQTVASLTTAKSDLVLDLVNEAKNEVLESRVWPFDVRHDGVLVTKPSVTDTTNGTVTNGSTTATLASFSGSVSDLSGDFVTRVAFTDSSSYGNTAFRAVSAEDIGSSTMRLTLAADWPGTSASATAAYQTFAAEYLLPDTVRSLLTVRYQEEEVALQWIDPSLDFEQLVPRPLGEVSDQVRWAGVGGWAEGTFDAGSQSAASARKLRLVLYPVPETRIALHYSYVARHPDLTTGTDTLDDVPSPVVDEIVHEAYARYLLTGAGNDTEAGAINRRIARSSRREKHQNARFDPFRRKTLQPVGGASGPSLRDRMPSPFGQSEL